MALLKVVYYPDDPLKQRADPVESFDANLRKLAEDMFETMYTFEGVGLAGPQVGISKRILVLHEPEGAEMCLVNPEIVEFGEEEAEGEEGCLSLPGIYAMVTRPTRVKVRAFDLEQNLLEFDAEDFLARVIQHERDHLDGIVFPERLDIITRQATFEAWATMREQVLAERREAEHAS